MHHKIDWLAKRDALRATAEALIPDFGKVSSDPIPMEILMNELLIHKVELEVQIDELKRSNLAMEESRDRYLDLYDRSPVSFITINRDGVISELNLKAAELLGIDRSQMLHQRFSQHVSVNDIDKWNLFFLSVMDKKIAAPESFTLNLIDANGIDFTAYVHCQREISADQLFTLRLTLISLD